VKRWIGLTAVLLLAYVASGLSFVQPDEQAIVLRFGRALDRPWDPGAHLGLPWGLDRVCRVKTREMKRVTVGPLNLAGDAVGARPAQFLTGDRNLVNIRATVQYTIKDPARYLFCTGDVDALVARSGEAALSEVLAEKPVDQALTLGRGELAVLVADHLQIASDRAGLGITIRSVDIGAAEPPAEVAEAFDDVISALRYREQQVNLAHSYANRVVAEAGADAQRVRDQAQRYREQLVQQATGDASRFEKLLPEYARSPDLTARRLFLEAMGDVLPRLRSKLLVAADSDLDLSILRGESP
jgi:membrane protease subunit HflK